MTIYNSVIKKYFTEKQGISEPKLLNYEKHNFYDCGKLNIIKSKEIL